MVERVPMTFSHKPMSALEMIFSIAATTEVISPDKSNVLLAELHVASSYLSQAQVRSAAARAAAA